MQITCPLHHKEHMYREEQTHTFHTTYPDGHVMYTDVQGTVHCTNVHVCTLYTGVHNTRVYPLIVLLGGGVGGNYNPP